ncbi:hypothetical protein [Photobacterium swingsii]|uniref:Uncharacterized protein n=1 Tax=Photobacterium swingsii TaxID=680026 RepID=A0A0J8VD14_9GAMM|nr:hypothetical protein [Photobacterium swingsii]KMV30425.1 hypothetical protein AB733_12260 [Photobacterium swingsii]PSW24392.1 hypothetical protein C9I94_10125 [Photobacterium swingsii]
MKKAVFRHKRALLRWGVVITLTLVSVLLLSELGQFLVWQFIGEQVPGIEIKVSPNNAMQAYQSAEYNALSSVLNIELDLTTLAVEKIR